MRTRSSSRTPGALLVGLLTVLVMPGLSWGLIASHQCTFCHQLHGAPGYTLLKDAQIEVLCLTCHGPGGTSTLKADIHMGEISCMGCHDPHDNRKNWLGGTNIKLVGTKQDATGLARIATPSNGIRDVVFESRGTDLGQPALHSFADNDQDANGVYDGVCELCHGSEHNRGRTCTICHSHATGFEPPR